jgi:hypothetical protein
MQCRPGHDLNGAKKLGFSELAIGDWVLMIVCRCLLQDIANTQLPMAISFARR